LANLKRTKVKICCISSVAEAQQAISCGANAIGLVGPMPSGPGIIGDELIAEIAATIPTGISSFLLTSETDADAIIAHHRRVNTTTIQLVDVVDIDTYHKVKKALSKIEIVQVIHVQNQHSLTEALRISPHVDALLLDSGNPNAAIKELGGTGRVHNWHISKEIVNAVDIPVYLAGGLNAANVGDAINLVEPFGVDLCSGVRTSKQLDQQKLIDFFEQVSTY